MIRLAKLLMLAGLIAGSGVLALALAPWLDLEQEFGLGWLYAVRGPLPAPPAVVVVAIEEESARQMGVAGKPSDWPRSLHAELVHYLHRSGARLIVFDMTFDQPAARPADDADFAAAIRAAGNVLVTTAVVQDALALPSSGGRPAALVVINRVIPPIPLIEQAVAGHAPFLLPKTSRVDGYWVSRGGAAALPTLPVLALRHCAEAPAAADDGPPAAMFERGHLQRMLAALPADSAMSHLYLYGPPQTLANLAYHEVLSLARGQPGPALADGYFRGKAVFVGLAARTPTGQDRQRDDYRTHYTQADGLNLSGVEIAATAFANLVEGRPLRPLPPAGQLALVLAWGGLLALICQRLAPAPATVTVLALALLYLGGVAERFIDAAAWWPWVILIGIQVPVALLASLTEGYRRSRRERASMKRAFGHFLPGAMVDQLSHGTGALTQSNRVMFGPCLATDAENYTTLAERMAPDALADVMNDYFAHLFVPVERSGGVVVDVVGDAMVAIWVGPQTADARRRSACLATLDIVGAIDRFHQGRSGGLVLPTRMGLHAGEMLVGNIGASGHFEYRAVGDTVNTASRLQGLNKLLGTRVLASDAAVRGLPDLLVRPMGSFLLSGKASALPVVQLLGRLETADAALLALCRLFDQALALHAGRQWWAAIEVLDGLLAHSPDDGPARFYRQRCATLLANDPGPGWQPTIVVQGK